MIRINQVPLKKEKKSEGYDCVDGSLRKETKAFEIGKSGLVKRQ